LFVILKNNWKYAFKRAITKSYPHNVRGGPEWQSLVINSFTRPEKMTFLSSLVYGKLIGLPPFALPLSSHLRALYLFRPSPFALGHVFPLAFSLRPVRSATATAAL
jgi:hypothetical protein